MALKQIIPLSLTLVGDGTSTVFTYALGNFYQSALGYPVPFPTSGVVPSSVAVNAPPVPVTSTTVDANGNLTLTLTTALGNGVAASFEIDLYYNSGAASSASPTQTQNVNITGGSVTIGGTTAVTQSTSPWVVSLTSTTITGTVAVTQSTSPWVVAGGLTHNNAAPAATNVGALVAVASTAAPTYTTGDQVLLSTDLAGNLRVSSAGGTQSSNIIQWNGVALGSPSNYGTSPGAVSVIGVNAFVTNTVPVTLTSTTITGTVAATQSGNWTTRIVGNAGATLDAVTGIATAPTNGIAVLGVSPSVTPTLSGGQSAALQLDASGRLNTDMQMWAGTQLGTPTNFGTTPGAVVAGSVNSSVFIGTTAAVAASAGVQKVGISGNAGASLDSTVGSGAAPANAIAVSGIYNTTLSAPTNAQATAVQTDQAANLLMFPGVQFKAGTAWTSGTTINTLQFPTGTATQGQLLGGGVVLVQLNQTTTLTGGAVTFQGTYDNVNWVTIPVAQVLNPNTFASLTNPYTFTASTNQPFLLLVQGYIGIRANLTTVITGTGSVTPQWSSLSWAPANLPVNVTITGSTGTTAVQGTLTNNNAAPAANNVGVLPAIAETAYATVTYTTGDMVLPVTDLHGALNQDLQAIGGTAVRSNQTTTAAGVLDVNIVGSLGVTNSVTNGTFIAITDNTTKAGVIAATTALKTDLSSVAGTATVVAAAGIQKVGISGATGATMDAVITAATAPANGIATLGVYNSTQPSLATGQSVALQSDGAGNLHIAYGCNVTAGAAWTSGTAVNTAQYITGTTTIGEPMGKPAVVIQLNQTTTLTGGAVTFEGTYDGTNWVTIPVAQIIHPETFDQLTNPYTFVANTNQPFMILMQGYQNMRLRVSTVITGTGSVTPQWDARNILPLQSVIVTASTTGGVNATSGSIGATKTAIKTSAGVVMGWYFYNSNSSVAYVQIFANTVAGVTLGTTAPTMSLGIPPGSAANMAFDVGINFATAITIAITTTRAGATGPTNTVDYNVFWL
jgi:hypothetical protein